MVSRAIFVASLCLFSMTHVSAIRGALFRSGRSPLLARAPNSELVKALFVNNAPEWMDEKDGHDFMEVRLNAAEQDRLVNRLRAFMSGRRVDNFP